MLKRSRKRSRKTTLGKRRSLGRSCRTKARKGRSPGRSRRRRTKARKGALHKNENLLEDETFDAYATEISLDAYITTGAGHPTDSSVG